MHHLSVEVRAPQRLVPSLRHAVHAVLATIAIIAPVRGDVIDVADGVVAADATDGLCSLVEAMENALDDVDGDVHLDCMPGDPTGGDTLVLPAGSTYTLTAVHNGASGGTGLPQVDGALTFEGGPATVERDPAAPVFRLFLVTASGDLTLRNLTLRGGQAGGSFRQGGAVRNAGVTTLDACVVTGNTGMLGGALFNQGTLNVSGSTLGDNVATVSGGALFNHTSAVATVGLSSFENNFATAHGGAAYVNPSGDVEFDRCLFTGNEAGGGDGGALRCAGVLTLTNCTLSGNYADGGIGGALHVTGAGDVDMAQTTVYGNTGPAVGVDSANAVVVMANTIVGGSMSAMDCWAGTGTVTDGGFNLVEDGSCLQDATSMAGNPMLGPLQNNGGPTRTHALLPGSPAVNGSGCPGRPMDVDQRGVARPQGSMCDMGSFELDEAVVTVAAASAEESEGALAFTVTRSHAAHQVVVYWSTESGSAVAGVDFEAVTAGSVVLDADGALEQSFVVTLFDDGVVEADETFTVNLETAEGGALGTSSATGTVVNDDVATVAFAGRAGSVPEGGSAYAVEVTFAGETDVPLALTVVDTLQGTAEAGADYVPFDTVPLVFPAGSTDGDTLTALLTPVDDDEVEGDEDVVLGLDFGVEAALTMGSPDTHVVTLVDDDEEAKPLEVHVDFLPGECPNTLPVNGGGHLQVALLGTEFVDVRDVDLDSLTLTRADGVGGEVLPQFDRGVPGALTADVTAPYTHNACKCEEPKADGFADLVVRFPRPEVVDVLQLRGVGSGNHATLVLSGTMLDGTPFESSDCVLLKGPRGNHNVVVNPGGGPNPGGGAGSGKNETRALEAVGPADLGRVGCGALSPAMLLSMLAGLVPLARQRR